MFENLTKLPKEIIFIIEQYLPLVDQPNLLLLNKAMRDSAEFMLKLRYDDSAIPGIICNWLSDNLGLFQRWFEQCHLDTLKICSMDDLRTSSRKDYYKMRYVVYAIYYASLTSAKRKNLSLDLDIELLHQSIKLIIKKPPELFLNKNDFALYRHLYPIYLQPQHQNILSRWTDTVRYPNNDVYMLMQHILCCSNINILKQNAVIFKQRINYALKNLHTVFPNMNETAQTKIKNLLKSCIITLNAATGIKPTTAQINAITGTFINLAIANLKKANLSGAYLSGAYLLGANLPGADLAGANLEGADLEGANLEGANLLGANLSGADLAGTKWLGANLSGAKWFGVNLSGADLLWANLKGANLPKVNLEGANLSGTKWFEANLSGANLKKANLKKADLEDADLSEAKLIKANLSGANLLGANLEGVKLFGAIINDTTLKDIGIDSSTLTLLIQDGEREAASSKPQKHVFTMINILMPYLPEEEKVKFALYFYNNTQSNNHHLKTRNIFKKTYFEKLSIKIHGILNNADHEEIVFALKKQTKTSSASNLLFMFAKLGNENNTQSNKQLKNQIMQLIFNSPKHNNNNNENTQKIPLLITECNNNDLAKLYSNMLITLQPTFHIAVKKLLLQGLFKLYFGALDISIKENIQCSQEQLLNNIKNIKSNNKNFTPNHTFFKAPDNTSSNPNLQNRVGQFCSLRSKLKLDQSNNKKPALTL